jgi:hypothetical protein
LAKGVSQGVLLSEVLNVQSLFENDLRDLSPEEQETLNTIARSAPILASEAFEISTKEVIQTLLDRRLLIQVGERIDVYWDIFRDYLVQGSVPLQESFIVRLTPNTTIRLLKTIRESGGRTTTDQAAALLGTSKEAVHNMARDLRQLGILALVENELRLAEDIDPSAPNESIKLKAGAVLRRHRAYGVLERLAGTAGIVETSAFAAALASEYPAIRGQPKTWANYASAFAYWFQVGGLAAVVRDKLRLDVPVDGVEDLFKLRKGPRDRGLVVFPRAAPGPCMRLLSRLVAGETVSAVGAAFADLRHLGWIAVGSHGGASATDMGRAVASETGSAQKAIVAKYVMKQQGLAIAADLIAKDPATTPTDIGRAIAQHYGLTWKTGTMWGTGKHSRAWLRAAGVRTTVKRPGGRRSAHTTDVPAKAPSSPGLQLTLDERPTPAAVRPPSLSDR